MKPEGGYTKREMQKLCALYGDLDFVDVTIFGDPERMYLLTSPRCAYCGSPVAEAQCRGCGAGPRDGSL